MVAYVSQRVDVFSYYTAQQDALAQPSRVLRHVSERFTDTQAAASVACDGEVDAARPGIRSVGVCEDKELVAVPTGVFIVARAVVARVEDGEARRRGRDGDWRVGWRGGIGRRRSVDGG